MVLRGARRIPEECRTVFERLLARLGILEDVDEEFEEDEEQLQERKRRVLNPVPPDSALVVVRGMQCVQRREEIAEALHQGKLVLVDLRLVERTLGQGTLDFICGVAYGTKGAVMRLLPGIFLAMAHRTLVEEWADKQLSEEEMKE